MESKKGYVINIKERKVETIEEFEARIRAEDMAMFTEKINTLIKKLGGKHDS